jgi:hypothetical protein
LGEVPITFGALFPVGFRAAERSRVMRIEPRDYHAIAAVKPAVAAEVGRLAAHRMSGSRGLSGIAAETSPPRAVVLGARWDPASAELRRFLDRNQIRFKWLVPDAADLTVEWGEPLPAEADWPVIRLVDGKTVARPQPRRVAELLGLGTEPRAAEYDVVIVGAGRRRSGGAGGRGLRRVRGAADARLRARGARWSGRHLVAHRELPRLPIRRVGRRARPARVAAGAAAGRGDSRNAVDHADRHRHTAAAPGRRRCPAWADDHPRLRSRVAAPRC